MAVIFISFIFCYKIVLIFYNYIIYVVPHNLLIMNEKGKSTLKIGKEKLKLFKN
jgi:hypothetical protein